MHIQASVPVWVGGLRSFWRLHLPCRPLWSAHENRLVPDTIWRFEVVGHEHQGVIARCVFQSVVCKVTSVFCDEICTNDTSCCPLYKEGKDLAGKCSVVTTVSPTYERIYRFDGRIHDVVSDYSSTAAAKPDKHTPQPACTDDLFGLYLVNLTFCVATALWTLATTSFSSCLQACSRA